MSNIYYQRPNNSNKRNENNTGRPTAYEQQENQYYQPNYRAPKYESYSGPVVVKQSSVKELVTSIILVVLSISLVIAIITLGAELSDINRTYEKDSNSFWWEYDSGRYADSIKSRYENIYRGVKETTELTQCYAVSEYFEAASLYKAAVHVGKEDKAAEYLEAMAEAYTKMGDVSYLAEDIDTRLGITDIVK